MTPSFQSCELHTDQHTIMGHLPNISHRRCSPYFLPGSASLNPPSSNRQHAALAVHVVMANRKLSFFALYDHSRLLEIVKETGCGFSLRSLPTGTSSVIFAIFLQFWTSVAAGDSKLRQQPSIRSGTWLPTSQVPQGLPLQSVQAMAAQSMFSPRRS